MILKGNQRGGARNLALHLLKDENEHVEIYELRGFMSDNLVSALKETYEISKATRAKKYLYSLSVNPPENENVTTQDFINAINRVEKELKLKNHQRVIVFHEKNGRRHAHAVWSRIDTQQMKAIDIYQDWPKLKALTRELFLEHGWKVPEGLIDKRKRSPNKFTLAQWQQAKRLGKVPAQIRADLQSAWALSDDKISFETALKERGYWLAHGDRRSVVVLDHKCEIFSLGKKWLGVPMKDVRMRIGDKNELRSVERTRTLIAKVMSEHLTKLRNEQSSAIETRTVLLKDQLKHLVKIQRQERTDLKAVQEQRWQKEVQARQARYNKGLKGLLDLMTGKRRKIKERNREETKAAKIRDEQERDTLVLMHLEQRRTLGRRLKRLRTYEQDSNQSLSHDRNQYQEIKRGLRDKFGKTEQRKNRKNCGPSRGR